MIEVILRVQMVPGGPISEIPVYGVDAPTLANSAFMAGIHYKTDHPNFYIESVESTPLWGGSVI
jgi:hypothetical protein